MRFLARLFVNGLAIIVAAWMLPGLHLASPGTALAAGAVLGLVNVLVKPLLFVLTLPLTLVTLGLFLFVVNALCLRLTAALIPGFSVDGFWWSLIGALVVSVVSWILNGVLLPSRDDRRLHEIR